jgi:glycosyltransferase involved in cell wall biosynthesis
LPALPNVNLAIVGSGPIEQKLKDQAARLGVADRVRFVGSVDQGLLPVYYSSADALVLASSREGMANVLLESLACGLPVVATPIWGTPEVIRCREAGVLTRDRSAGAIRAAVEDLFHDYPERVSTRRYSERFSWDDTTHGQVEIFDRIRCVRN